MEFLHQLFDVKGGGLQQLIISFGYVFLFGIIFAETGLLIGFFLPGDSLLFIAGLVAANGNLNIALLLLLLSIAAVAGDSVGFLIGRKAGPALFKRNDSKLFKRKHLDSAHEFYEKHGPKTIILARFVPIVRTFAPTVAGAAGMDYRQFVMFNVIGGISWIFSMTLLGYFLGNVPVVKDNLEKAVIGIVILSIVPVILHAVKEKRAAR
ncbi:protein DedA [Abditibacteriota bacterium]|nr:protein DedA [Abditibacteriota bacterium]